jgi:cysteine desulfurase/selenocysteine lyase
MRLVIVVLFSLCVASIGGYQAHFAQNNICHRGRRRSSSSVVASETAEASLIKRRTDFALLDQSVWEDKPLVYLDSAATSQKPAAVIDAMARHLTRDNANVHRGAHTLSARSTESYEASRASVARFIGASDAREIVFTRGATEAINLVAASWGSRLQKGDEVVLSVIEHHSNLVPWQVCEEQQAAAAAAHTYPPHCCLTRSRSRVAIPQLLAQQKGLVLKYARLADDESLDVAHLSTLITPKTKLVALAHVSNTLGCVTPVAEVVALAKANGAAVLLDACQSVRNSTHSSTAATARATRLTSSLLLLHTGASYAD